MTNADSERDLVLLWSGLVGVIGNVVAVVLLADQPDAYRLAGLDAWARQIAEHPSATAASAVTFTVGLVGLAIWALTLRRHLNSELSRAGGLITAIGALGNGLGTITPLVLALHVADASEAVRPLSRALLGITLSLDALFNLLLGVGLLAIATGLPKEVKSGVRLLAIAAGVASLPVSAQAIVDSAAKLLVIAAPLWLSFITIISFGQWRRDASHAH